jgi:hypothetical protein
VSGPPRVPVRGGPNRANQGLRRGWRENVRAAESFRCLGVMALGTAGAAPVKGCLTSIFQPERKTRPSRWHALHGSPNCANAAMATPRICRRFTRSSESQRSLTFTLASPDCKRSKQLSDSLRNRAMALKIAVGKVTFDEAGGAKAKCILAGRESVWRRNRQSAQLFSEVAFFCSVAGWGGKNARHGR